MQIPTNEKTSLNLMHGYLTFQIFLNTTKSFTIEIAISDTNNGKKRILLSACSKEFVKNQFGITVNDDIADAICIGFAAVGGTIKIPT